MLDKTHTRTYTNINKLKKEKSRRKDTHQHKHNKMAVKYIFLTHLIVCGWMDGWGEGRGESLHNTYISTYVCVYACYLSGSWVPVVPLGVHGILVLNDMAQVLVVYLATLDEKLVRTPDFEETNLKPKFINVIGKAV